MYMDLSSASEPQTRVFIMDLGANGLRFKREDNQPFDTADVAGKSLTFDGDWGARENLRRGIPQDLRGHRRGIRGCCRR